jgi:hypothetical protein
MSSLPDNELLSAYLDGELTAAERADVERLLAADPAARRLLDELRAVGQALRWLPAEKLSVNLRDQVLQIAKQRKSAETVTPAETPPVAIPPWSERWKNRRLWVWPAIIVAVALLLMLFSPQQPEPNAPRNRTAARAEKKDEYRARERIAEAEKTGEVLKSDKEGKTISDFTASEAAPAVGVPMKPAPGAAKAPQYAFEPAEKKAADKKAAPAAAEKPSLPAETAPPAPVKAVPLYGQPLAKRGAESAPNQAGIADESMKYKATPDGGQVAGGRTLGKAAGRRTLGKAAGGYNVDQNQAVLDNTVQLAEPPAAADGLLFVYCDINPAAQAAKPFDKLLTANGIQFVDADQSEPEVAQLEANKPNTAKSEVAQTKPAELADNFKTRKASSQQPSRSAGAKVGQQAAAAEETPPIDLVYVEAPPAQVESVLAAINADNKTFSAMQVTPTPDVPNQRRFAQFNRTTNALRPPTQNGHAQSSLGVAASSEKSQRGFGGRQIVPQPSEKFFTDILNNTPPPTNRYARQNAARQMSNFAQRIRPPQQLDSQERFGGTNLQARGKSEIGGLGRTVVQQAPGGPPAIAQQNTAGFATGQQKKFLSQQTARSENQRVLFVIRNFTPPSVEVAPAVGAEAKPESGKSVPAKQP